MEGYIAQIIMFAGNFAPRNWAFCQGQIISISQNTALFSLLGTTYGGNGQTNFALPDFRGRVAMGTGTGPGLSPRTLGQTGGTNTTTLTNANLPAHSHTVVVRVPVSDSTANSTEADGKILATPVSNIYTAATNASGNLGGVSATVGNAGGSQPFSNMQPYLGMNFVICMSGFFPSRN